MNDRIIGNWKTTLIGIVLMLVALAFVWYGRITWGEFSAFLPTVFGLIWVKDSFLSSFIGKTGMIILLMSTISSCHTTKYVAVGTDTTIRVTERLVDIQPKSDSSSVLLNLACDSLNRVYIKMLGESHGNTTVNTVYLRNDSLIVKTIFKPGPEKVVVKDSVVTVVKEVPVPVPGKDVNVMYWWQTALMWIGIASLIIGVIILVIKFK